MPCVITTTSGRDELQPKRFVNILTADPRDLLNLDLSQGDQAQHRCKQAFGRNRRRFAIATIVVRSRHRAAGSERMTKIIALRSGASHQKPPINDVLHPKLYYYEFFRN
jgi:hypothetical protein